ncbi:MAG: YkgJ family cysteine cluster protein [Saprospiraceae bacterium]
MKEIIQNWQALQKNDHRAFLSFFFSIRKQKNTLVSTVKDFHEEAFQKIDCLQCANCCKTSPALLLPEDISRISKYLNISTKEFRKNFVLEDVNGEFSLNKVPCHFLQSDNTCAIYEIRPQACRRFPHTDESDYVDRSHLNAKNVVVCPAAFYVAERLRTHLENLQKEE